MVDLALLGFLAGSAQPGPVLVDRIKQAGGDHFWPTKDFIRDRLICLLSKGYVELGAGGELVATSDGRDQVLKLLRLELDPTATILRTACTALKRCLLEQVDPVMRADIVNALCSSRACYPAASPEIAPINCPLMNRYLVLEQKRRTHEQRFWQDTLLEEGLLDPNH